MTFSPEIGPGMMLKSAAPRREANVLRHQLPREEGGHTRSRYSSQGSRTTLLLRSLNPTPQPQTHESFHEATLKDMAAPLAFVIEPLSVNTVQKLHASLKIGIWCFDE